ncbi:phage tail protein [Teredinibacter turnerae]|uniref:phage tail protein n=1 Tax=Teredinibacter turnerae TaxID=2426 RepID=UPI0005F7C4A9|nr:tail fiber protein [Teredinibacter turnerae]
MQPILGDIHLFGFNFGQEGWALCQGQLMAIQDNTALYSLIGTHYGGDGRSSFGIPDLRGRVPLGTGNPPGGSQWPMGRGAGSETCVIEESQMPTHSHPANFSSQASLVGTTDPADLATPETGAVLANVVAGGTGTDKPEKIYTVTTANPVALGGLDVTGEVQVGNAGNSSLFSLLQPSLAVSYAIATEGVYPNRS